MYNCLCITHPQKCFKHSECRSVWRNVTPFCQCESWIPAVVSFDEITDRCGSFHDEQPKRTRVAVEQSSISVLNTNKGYLSIKFESKDLESNFDTLIQSTKQSITFVGFLRLIENYTCSLFGKIKIDLPQIKLVTTWIFQKWEFLVQKLRKQRLNMLLNATGSFALVDHCIARH